MRVLTSNPPGEKKKTQLIAKYIGAGGLTLGRYDVKQ